MEKRIVVTGGTGFIGRALCAKMTAEGFEVVVLSRQREAASALGERVQVVEWDGQRIAGWSRYVEGAVAIVNLAGDNIASGRWTTKKKAKVLASRIDASRAVATAVEQASVKPAVVIQGSAIGYYGNRDEEELDEASAAGEGFLADVTKKWEEAIAPVNALGVRLAVLRIGAVLGSADGMMPRVLGAFRWFVGGPLGSGKGWLSWIHLEDVTRAIVFLIERQGAGGVFNLTAPHPIISRSFYQTLAKVMHRPCWLQVPGWALKMLMGQMAEELILSGQRVLPKRLSEAGYRFVYPDLTGALEEIAGPKAKPLPRLKAPPDSGRENRYVQ